MRGMCPVLMACACACAGGAGGARRAPATALPPPTPAGESCDSQLEDAGPGHHGRHRFEGADERIGFRDDAGQVVIPPRFLHAYEFGPGGIAAVIEPAEGEGVRMGFIDVDGRWLADAYRFDNGPDYFQEGLARIVAGGKVGYIARDGTIVIEPRFAGATSFCHGIATVHDGAQEWEIDRSGAAVGARRRHGRPPGRDGN